MNYQDKVKDQQPSAFFADGASARAPIPGTVAEEMPAQERLLGDGQVGRHAHWGDGIPVHDAIDGGRALASTRPTWRAAANAIADQLRSLPRRGRRREGDHVQVRPQRRGQLSCRPPAQGNRRRDSSTPSPTARARCSATATTFTVDDRWRIVMYIRALQRGPECHALRMPLPPNSRSSTRRRSPPLPPPPAPPAASATMNAFSRFRTLR